jgi:hypothetical protein
MLTVLLAASGVFGATSPPVRGRAVGQSAFSRRALLPLPLLFALPVPGAHAAEMTEVEAREALTRKLNAATEAGKGIDVDRRGKFNEKERAPAGCLLRRVRLVPTCGLSVHARQSPLRHVHSTHPHPPISNCRHPPPIHPHGRHATTGGRL